jgi:hypothetical protein
MANYDFVNSQGQSNRELPGAQGNNTLQPFRTSRYMESIVQPFDDRVAADEGSCFIATNATLGTAISGTAAPTAFSATVALMSIFNAVQAVETAAKRIYLRWILLEVRAAGTNGTNFNFAMSVDAGNRFASGGTAIVPTSGNTALSPSTQATVNFGALTAGAATSAVRRVAHGQIRPVIKVIGDRYLFVFGSSAPPTSGVVVDGTAASVIPVQCPPVILGQNSTFLLHETAASQSVAATYEFSACWVER